MSRKRASKRMASEPPWGIVTRLLTNRWKAVVVLIATSIFLIISILMLVDFVRLAIIGQPEWVDVEMGELLPGASREAYLDRLADNEYSRIRHIYSFNGQEGQVLRILVVPGSELYVSIRIQKGLQLALGSTPAYTSRSIHGVPSEVSVVLPEDGDYTIILVGSHAPDYYRISAEVTAPAE